MYQSCLPFLREMSDSLLKGCRVKAYDHTTLYTPDGVANYGALWLRDFSYMVEYAGDLIPTTDIIDCIEYAIKHRREDGWMPDRVTAEGLGVYAAGATGHPIGEANLDNTPFLIYTVYSLSQMISPEEFSPLFDKWYPYLMQGMRIIPINSENGLVYNDISSIHSPYGFTDTVAKSGSLFMESILLWRALRMMEELSAKKYSDDAKSYADAALSIEQSIASLKADIPGAYYAASGQCRQIDIWGIAYMLYIGFPLTEQDRNASLHFLFDNRARFMKHAQVRHLLDGEYWEKLLITIDPETYQNGAYWATATGWLIWCFHQIDPNIALQEAEEIVRFLKEDGSFECINEDYRKLPSFVVSATNVYGSFKRLAT